MACVAADGAVFHRLEVLRADDVAAAGDGHEEVAQGGRLLHLHHAEAVHHRLHRLDRVDFGDDHLGAEALGPHSDALAAPAVACDHDGLACDDEVGCAVDAVPDTLTGAVAVVKEMLAVGIVDEHHREEELLLGVEGDEAVYACGGLLAAAYDVRNELGELAVDAGNQVASIVDDDVRLMFETHFDMSEVFFFCRSVICEYCKT